MAWKDSQQAPDSQNFLRNYPWATRQGVGAAIDSSFYPIVKRRKISGGTRSDAGRQCRDTFASLKKTCRQHGLSFWDYLTDRLNGTGSFPRLADVIEYASCWLPCGQCRGY
ncbi:hypothetical protein [Endozoicomonas euniceicola]|uniref:Transposase IS66 C-terminal domain-containing protein n=1 Tax=Endozoicomonas euniceicola TaxID=1234143 RepID=A0ABY6H0M3_9GAMM|nr:hypothetical protein [Endozoicomonas euniceicola]UYM17704.1 hypothetical protein NX720_07295 [Endozoicomonas euniceicola]